MCGILISGLATRLSSFRSWKKISFHRPVSVREHRWNLVKGVLDHLWTILVVYLCITFKIKVIVKLVVDAWRFVGRFTKQLMTKAAFASKPVCIQRKKEKDKKKQWDEDHKRISVARDVHESWKKIKWMCVPIRRIRPSLNIFCPVGVAKKSEAPICSARTSLTFPSSFCQAGTSTTVGVPWLCKLQRNKHELPVHTPSPNTHRFLVLQISPLHSKGRQYVFFNCTSEILLAIIARLSVSLFFKQKGHRPDNLFSNTREVPTSKSRNLFALSRDAVSGDFYW